MTQAGVSEREALLNSMVEGGWPLLIEEEVERLHRDVRRLKQAGRIMPH
jgi:hypothetical protein